MTLLFFLIFLTRSLVQFSLYMLCHFHLVSLHNFFLSFVFGSLNMMYLNKCVYVCVCSCVCACAYDNIYPVTSAQVFWVCVLMSCIIWGEVSIHQLVKDFFFLSLLFLFFFFFFYLKYFGLFKRHFWVGSRILFFP